MKNDEFLNLTEEEIDFMYSYYLESKKYDWLNLEKDINNKIFMQIDIKKLKTESNNMQTECLKCKKKYVTGIYSINQKKIFCPYCGGEIRVGKEVVL